MNIYAPQVSTSILAIARAQRGFVLVVTLIVLAAMSLAAVALVRTVDTSTLLARNISFKRDALNRSDVAIEAAINQFRSTGYFTAGTNTTTSDQTRNFSAIMVATDADGVPTVMKSADSAGKFTGGQMGTAGPSAISSSFDLGMMPIYFIERMCTAIGDPSIENCASNGRAAAGGTQSNDRPPQIFPPMFRITARVTGPRNTVAYVQAIFSL